MLKLHRYTKSINLPYPTFPTVLSGICNGSFVNKTKVASLNFLEHRIGKYKMCFLLDPHDLDLD
jgi:hypothetical protein